MKKLFIVLLALFLLPGIVSAMTFPIDIENCQIKYGRVVLTGWYSQARYYGRHRALDIPAVIGTPVKAVVSGRVIEKGFEYNTGKKQCFGNYVVVQASNGNRWYYAHLNSYDVKLNERIAEGQAIGEVGYTGLDHKAPHLHIECRDLNNRKISFTRDLGRVIKSLIEDQKTKFAFTLRE